MSQLFKTEISGGLLGDFLLCLRGCEEGDGECEKQGWEEGEVRQVLDILGALSESRRFSLSLVFLSAAERQSCVELFDKLSCVHEVVETEELSQKLAALRKLYSV